MPTYVYQCPVCGARFEKSQRSQDGPVTCPQGHRGARRVFVPVGIVFKGPGFYSTDNRRGKETE